MKTVVCTKTGNTKSISLNTSYTVVAETEKRYALVNDKGIQANYCKSLFTEETVVTPIRVARDPRPVAVPPPPVVVVPRQQINEVNVSVYINQDTEEGEIEVSFDATAGDSFRVESNITLFEGGTNISCGITQLTSLDALCSAITNFKERIFQQLNNLENTDVNVTLDDINQADILESVLNEIVENAEDTGLILISTNLNSVLTTSEYVEVLDRMSSATVETRNPNSGNRIKLWTLQITE